jgi:hypothetical protein
LHARDGFDHRSRRVVDATVAAEVAGIVVRDFCVEPARLELPVGHEAAQQLRMVHDLEVAAE